MTLKPQLKNMKKRKFMRKIDMLVAYKFQGNDFQVFYDDINQSFCILKNICKVCKKNWSHGINQCIFCGTKNHFVWICNSCNDIQGLATSDPKVCRNDKCQKKNNYFKKCFNKDCPSNNDKTLANIIHSLNNSKSGLFSKKSPFKISQNFCVDIDCVSEENIFLSKSFKVVTIDKEKNFIKANYMKLSENYDFLIIFSEDTENFLILTKIKENTFQNDIEISSLT